ncbi:hypothetical protein N5I81_013300 [Klebsiella michiganensis]|uniref:hypothetical protein n=1 Tax=Klebsiella michiganensis TaxID=1134687 RepID=UPI0022460D94|nr:hypothetical protein [Klebsiella michiganensis]MCW9338075.1 hypothetical protein [Klebsiella michiganensis]
MIYKTDDFTGRVEEIIRTSISDKSGHEWDEDFITLSLLSDLKKALHGVKLIGRSFKSNINWQIYKLKGTYETHYGDIALVININYKDGTSIHGTAFLEAKKRDWRKTTFSAMKTAQAKRILKNSPFSQYLLYDYEEITGFLSERVHSEYMDNSWYKRGVDIPFSRVTRAVCVPLNLAIATGHKDTLLYRHGLPLSMMLSNRYFQGLDLEFDETSIKVATGFLTKFGLPKFVLKIDILENGTEAVDKNLGVNQSEYVQLD